MIYDDETRDLFANPPPRKPPAAVEVQAESNPAPAGAEPSLGARLRTAREAAGLSIQECAQKLHLPTAVLQRVEADDSGSPEHFVFLRGALVGYATLLGLPPETCNEALRTAAPTEQPALVSVARTSALHRLLHRYGTAATYIVLTATIVVPLILLGLRGGLHRPSARIVSLDQAAVAAAPHVPTTGGNGEARTGGPQSSDTMPFRASMTPFAAIGLHDSDDPVAPAAAPAASTAPSASTPTQKSTAVPTPGSTLAALAQPPVAPAPVPAVEPHSVTLMASADCWFKITDAAGSKIAVGTLHAGQTRTWHSTGPVHMTLGNAAAVTVLRDGKTLDLDTSSNGDVQHLVLFAPLAGSSEHD